MKKNKHFSSFGRTTLLLITFVFISAGCASLPEARFPQKNLTATNAATIQLVRTNPNQNWYSFGGNAVIKFGKKYVIPVKEEWEIKKGFSIFTKVNFNNNAIFKIPVGKYKIRLYLLAKTHPYLPGERRMLKTDPYIFEAGGTYKVNLYAESVTNVVFMSKIMNIERVE